VPYTNVYATDSSVCFAAIYLVRFVDGRIVEWWGGGPLAARSTR
jgi:hypothetical protein